jgi:hypothetical protein
MSVSLAFKNSLPDTSENSDASIPDDFSSLSCGKLPVVALDFNQIWRCLLQGVRKLSCTPFVPRRSAQ